MTHGKEDPRVATAQCDLGYTYYFLGMKEEALKMYESALEIKRKKCSP